MRIENKRIVIINQNSGYLMIDLSNAFQDAGYDVTLVAGRLIKRDIPLSSEVRFKEIIKYQRCSIFKRLFTWGWAALQIIIYVWVKCRNKHLIIVSNPPFAPLLPLFLKNEFSLLIYDIFPDALTEFGIYSSNSLLVKLWQNANKKTFRKAERIITLTPGMKSVIARYAMEKPVEVIPIWTDNNFFKPIKKEENKFIKRYNLSGKFIVMYSGNLGYSHDVEVLVELAVITKDKNVQFIIIGEGDKKEILKNKITKLKLNNCIMLPFQKPEDFSFSLAAADIAVVTLGKKASKLSVPSKIYNLMSVGVPLLCIAGADSELKHLIDLYKIGQCFQTKQLAEMKNFILDIKQNSKKRQFFSENGLKASRNFGMENIQKFL